MSRVLARYLLHVVPGLEELALQEAEGAFEQARVRRVLRALDERTSLLVLDLSARPTELLELGLIEDAFAALVLVDGIPTDRTGLAAIRTAVEGADCEPALALHRLVWPRRKRSTTYRVIARMSGHHAYRRVDAQRAVEGAVARRFPAWRLVADDSDLELWISVIGGTALVGLRLSDESLRHRDYKAANLPASLKPTIARAMARLSRPEDGDVVLDPFCGTGTILIERALERRHGLLLGGDWDSAALAAAAQNIGPRYKPIALCRLDARCLPLADGSVSRVITNPPFGRQIGTLEGNRTLYPAMLREAARVLRPGGLAVVLAADRGLIRRAIGLHLTVVREVPVLVRGQQATILVLERGAQPRGGNR